jgi:hypothetical protein
MNRPPSEGGELLPFDSDESGSMRPRKDSETMSPILRQHSALASDFAVGREKQVALLGNDGQRLQLHLCASVGDLLNPAFKQIHQACSNPALLLYSHRHSSRLIEP